MKVRTKYSVEKMQQVFEYLKSCKANQRPREYKIVVNGLEVVGRTSKLDHFHDFLHFSSNATKQLTVTTYYRELIELVHDFDFTTGDVHESPSMLERFRTALELFRKKCARLAIEKKRADRAKKFERISEGKILDLGDTIIICIPKKELKAHMDEMESAAIVQFPHLRHVFRIARKILFTR